MKQIQISASDEIFLSNQIMFPIYSPQNKHYDLKSSSNLWISSHMWLAHSR